MERHAPVKKLKPKEIKLKAKPWINHKLFHTIKMKNKLFERKKRQPNNENVKILYNLFRNKVNRELSKSKKSYYATYFENHCNNIKKTWEGIRSLINIKNPVNPRIAQLNINGIIIDKPKQVANEVNNFFVNVGPNTENDVPKVPNILPDNFLKNRNQFNLIIAHVTNEEVLEIIKSLTNKANGPSSIPLNLLQDVADIIVFPLCHIINKSFLKGIFPDTLKVVKVVPLHKGVSMEQFQTNISLIYI